MLSYLLWHIQDYSEVVGKTFPVYTNENETGGILFVFLVYTMFKEVEAARRLTGNPKTQNTRPKELTPSVIYWRRLELLAKFGSEK